MNPSDWGRCQWQRLQDSGRTDVGSWQTVSWLPISRKPAESTADNDRFHTELVHLIDQRHELMRLPALIDWLAFADHWSPQFVFTAGRPALPTPLLYLKYVYPPLSDEYTGERCSDLATGGTSAASGVSSTSCPGTRPVLCAGASGSAEPAASGCWCSGHDECCTLMDPYRTAPHTTPHQPLGGTDGFPYRTQTP